MCAVAPHAQAVTLGDWSFDVDFTDSSGNGNDFLLDNGAVPLLPAKFGNAADFDGTSNLHITTSPTLFADHTTFSLSTHVWLDAVPVGADAGIVIGENFQWGLTYHNNSKVFGFVNNGGENVSATVLPGIHHLAQTFDGTTNRLYVDGALVDSKVTAFSSTGAVSEILAGLGPSGTFLDGAVDDTFITTDVLTDEQIAAIAAVPKPSALVLALFGLLSLGFFTWRRRAGTG